MAIKVQLALQGGGAKVVALVAAMKAVERLVDMKEIEVTRISGTSAGSLVATLFAAGVQMSNVVTLLQGKSIREVFPPSRLPPIIKIIRGKPVFDVESPLKQIIEELFRDRPRSVKPYSSPPVSFKDLDIPTFVQVSDLLARDTITRTGDDPIVSSVIDSCALPFLIRSHRSASAFHVDGGLVDNLPAELLVHDSRDFGPVLGLSFPREVGSSNGKGLRHYALSLLLTQIDNGVKRSKKLLGDSCVHEINTSLATLDFSKIFGAEIKSLEKELLSIQQQSETFFRGWKISQNSDKPTLGVSEVTGDPWMDALTSATPAAIALKRSLEDTYKMHQTVCSLGSLEYRSSRLIVRADSLKALDGISVDAGEIIESETHYEVTTGNLVTHAVTIAVDASNLLGSTPKIDQNIDGQFVPIDAVFNAPAIDETDELKRYMVMCFTKPLPANTKFRISFKDHVRGMLDGLLDIGRRNDYLSIRPNRQTNAPISLAQIILITPRLESYSIGFRQHPSMANASGRAMSLQELNATGITVPLGFEALGWQWENISFPIVPGKLMVSTFARKRVSSQSS